MRGKVTAEDLGKQVDDGRIDRTELKALALCGVALGEAVAHFVDQVLTPDRVVQQRPAFNGQFHPAAASVEKLNSQFGFELRNSIADGGLGHMHGAGCSGKTAQS